MAQETSGLKINQDDDATPVELGDSETGEITSEETQRLHSEIEETRENLGETIDAIQERLSLANLSEQVSEKVSDVIESAKDSVYDATLGKAVKFMKQARDGVMQTSAGRTIMANPIPFALIGAGAAMLIYNGVGNKNKRSRRAGYRTPNYVGSGGDQGKSAGMLNRATDTISDKAGNALDTISEKASGAYGSVTEIANKSYSGAADAANRAYDAVGEYGTAAKENLDHYIEEKPLAVAAAALAVGAAVGMAFPSTRYEGQLMGEARQNLLSKAEETASEFVDKAKQVATDVTQAAKNEISSQTGNSQNM
jgi:ElaB/YqjD/DUF883 family membrane-anchored ribosome-binding protein